MRFRYDELALSIVCDERVSMRLLGQDRVEAIRRLSAKDLTPREIADLLRTTESIVSGLQARFGIETRFRRHRR